MSTGDLNQPRVFGAFEAKTRFSELLERAAAGEEIIITRHGSQVARLVPIQTEPNAASRADAINRMRILAKQHQLGCPIDEMPS